jgi:hypothetical protein
MTRKMPPIAYIDMVADVTEGSGFVTAKPIRVPAGAIWHLYGIYLDIESEDERTEIDDYYELVVGGEKILIQKMTYLKRSMTMDPKTWNLQRGLAGEETEYSVANPGDSITVRVHYQNGKPHPHTHFWLGYSTESLRVNG